MDRFEYRQGELYCEAVPVRRIAEAVGTPVYIYSADTLRSHYRSLAAAFAELSPLICYSIKSLANLHVLRLLAAEGAGLTWSAAANSSAWARPAATCARSSSPAWARPTPRSAPPSPRASACFNVESEAEFENLSRLAAGRRRDGPTRRCA